MLSYLAEGMLGDYSSRIERSKHDIDNLNQGDITFRQEEIPMSRESSIARLLGAPAHELP